MNDCNELIFAVELGKECPQIDLHGLRAKQVEEIIENFIHSNYNKEKVIKISYGIGMGVLEKITLEIIENHPLVKKYKEIPGGNCIAILDF